MSNLLKIVFIYFWLLWISKIIANNILKGKLSKFKNKIPIGFIMFVGIYQIFIYVIQLFHLPTFILCVIIILLTFGILIKNLYENKKVEFLNKVEIIFSITILIISFIFFYFNQLTLGGGYSLADNFFYLDMINVNSCLLYTSNLFLI